MEKEKRHSLFRDVRFAINACRVDKNKKREVTYYRGILQHKHLLNNELRKLYPAQLQLLKRDDEDEDVQEENIIMPEPEKKTEKRCSERKKTTTSVILEEKQRMLEEAVKGRDGKEYLNLKICNFEGKGRGVIATKDINKGDYVVEYIGELIESRVKAKEREEKYAQEQKIIGCYMYYFKHNEKQYCIDATAESGKFGRLINHSRRSGNLVAKTLIINDDDDNNKNKPRLVFLAKEDIKEGQEILYDYGDRSKETLKHNPWLKL